MIRYFVLDVILTSVLTSAIVAGVVFWLLYHRYNQTYKKKIDDIMNKINQQSNSFTYQVDGLRQNLKEIIKSLNILKKKKT